MRAADKAELRGGPEVLPDAGVARLDALQLGVVDDVDGRALADEGLALGLCLGREVFDVVEAHRAVGGRGRAEVLEVGRDLRCDLRAEPLVEALYVGYLLHDLHADGGAEQLGLRFLFGLYLDYPVCAAPVVRQQPEVGHAAGDGAHELQHAGVAVAARAEHAVGIDDGGGLSPGEHLAHLRLVAHLVEVAGAGKGVAPEHAEFVELGLIALLLGVHDALEDEVLEEVRGHLGVERQGIGRELLLRDGAGIEQLVVEVVHRLHDADAEADDGVSVFAGDGDHLLGPESLAIHDERAHDLRHDLALSAVQHGLLFRREKHDNHLLVKILTEFYHNACAKSTQGEGLSCSGTRRGSCP